MSVCIALRDDYDSIRASGVCRSTVAIPDAKFGPELLALAAVYDGMERESRSR